MYPSAGGGTLLRKPAAKRGGGERHADNEPVLPFIQGWAADLTGFINSYWVIVLALAYLLFYALAGSKNVNKDIPVE